MLNAVLKNANIYTKNGFEYGTLVIENGIVSDTFSGGFVPDDAIIFDLKVALFFPALPMYMYICESRVFHTKKPLQAAQQRRREADIQMSAQCLT